MRSPAWVAVPDEDDEEVLGSMDSATDDDEEAMEHPHKKQKLCDV